ncbi:MAG TPA: UDP-2,3-diacylglucosamine diphosphatase LpxI [Chthoniobacterales bacterium]
MIDSLGIIAGNGVYPLELARNARAAGVVRVHVAAFDNETRPDLAALVDSIAWLRVGQLGKLIAFFKKCGVKEAIMAGQIAPRNLFDLRPDFRTLLLLGRIKERNAESLFGGIADELAKDGITLLPATTFLEQDLASAGHIGGPAVKRRVIEDLEFGYRIAKETSRLDIGQTVVVRNGTVLAVEAFEGTNEAILRGGKLGRGAAVMVKVSKPKQDFRFDVPVIGVQTLETATEAGILAIGVETGKTLLLEGKKVIAEANTRKISIHGIG